MLVQRISAHHGHVEAYTVEQQKAKTQFRQTFNVPFVLFLFINEIKEN